MFEEEPTFESYWMEKFSRTIFNSVRELGTELGNYCLDNKNWFDMNGSGNVIIELLEENGYRPTPELIKTFLQGYYSRAFGSVAYAAVGGV